MQHDKGMGTVSLRISRPRPPSSTFPVKQGSHRRDSHRVRRQQNDQTPTATTAQAPVPAPAKTHHTQHHHLRHSRGKLFAVLDVAIARASVAATSAASKSKGRTTSQTSASALIDPINGKALYPAIATGLRWVRAEAELQEEGAEEEGSSMSRFSCVGSILPVIDDAISTSEEESWERERFGKLVRFGIKCGNKQKARRRTRTSSGTKQPFGQKEKRRKTSRKASSSAAATPSTATRDLLMVPTREAPISSNQAGVDGAYTSNTTATTPALLSDSSMVELDLLPPIPPPLPPSLANTAAAATAPSSSIVSLPPPSSTFLRNERRKDRSHKSFARMKKPSAFPSADEIRKRKEADPEFSDAAVAKKKEELKQLYPADAEASGETSFVRSEDGSVRRDSGVKRAKLAHQRNNNEGIESPLELSEDDHSGDDSTDHLLIKHKRKGQRRSTSLILEEILALPPPPQVSRNRKSSVRVNRRAHTTSLASFTNSRRRSMRATARTYSDNDAEPYPKSRSRVQNQLEQSHENNEYCRSCGGSGQVLCCDGCPNSFHFACLSPPVDPEDPPSGRWFCPECCRSRGITSSGLPLPDEDEKIAMSTLLAGLDELNERGFSLPGDVRNYFIGVRTGPKGEYVPTVGDIGDNTGSRTVTWDSINASDSKVLPERPLATAKPEAFTTRITDSKGKFIFCVRCSRGASRSRSLIACGFCPCAWHEDCLPYPLLHHPAFRKRKSSHKWMCPNHVEHDLKTLQPEGISAYLRGTGVGRFRRPKHPRYIDVEVLPRSDDKENNGAGAGPHGENANGTVYRVSEDGLILDFVERVKKERIMRIAFREYYNALIERAIARGRMKQKQLSTKEFFSDEDDRMDAANTLLGMGEVSTDNSKTKMQNGGGGSLEKELAEGIRLMNERLGGEQEIEDANDEQTMLQSLRRLVDERIQSLEG